MQCNKCQETCRSLLPTRANRFGTKDPTALSVVPGKTLGRILFRLSRGKKVFETWRRFFIGNSSLADGQERHEWNIKFQTKLACPFGWVAKLSNVPVWGIWENPACDIWPSISSAIVGHRLPSSSIISHHLAFVHIISSVIKYHLQIHCLNIQERTVS